MCSDYSEGSVLVYHHTLIVKAVVYLGYTCFVIAIARYTLSPMALDKGRPL